MGHCDSSTLRCCDTLEFSDLPKATAATINACIPLQGLWLNCTAKTAKSLPPAGNAQRGFPVQPSWILSLYPFWPASAGHMSVSPSTAASLPVSHIFLVPLFSSLGSMQLSFSTMAPSLALLAP